MSDTITFFHGTTARAAQKIRAEGWVRIDVRAVVAEVAERHGFVADDLWRDIAIEPQAYLTQEGRGDWVSFALRYNIAAHNWAQRASEARREALWAVWRLRNPDRARSWTQHVDGHAWVLTEMAQDEPAVVECRVSYQELEAWGAREGGFILRPLPPLKFLRPGCPVVLPEIAIPTPLAPMDSMRVHRVERRVDWDVFALLLGLEPEEFITAAKKGLFGPKGTGGEGGPDSRAWWPQQQVERVLRRRGLPIPWQATPASTARGLGHSR